MQGGESAKDSQNYLLFVKNCRKGISKNRQVLKTCTYKDMMRAWCMPFVSAFGIILARKRMPRQSQQCIHNPFNTACRGCVLKAHKFSVCLLRARVRMLYACGRHPSTKTIQKCATHETHPSGENANMQFEAMRSAYKVQPEGSDATAKNSCSQRHKMQNTCRQARSRMLAV